MFDKESIEHYANSVRVDVYAKNLIFCTISLFFDVTFDLIKRSVVHITDITEEVQHIFTSSQLNANESIGRCNWSFLSTWWRHQMETFSALLATCAGNSPVTGEFPSQGPETRSFAVFFDLHGWVNQREAGNLRRHRTHYAVTVMRIPLCCRNVLWVSELHLGLRH